VVVVLCVGVAGGGGGVVVVVGGGGGGGVFRGEEVVGVQGTAKGEMLLWTDTNTKNTTGHAVCCLRKDVRTRTKTAE
jgi:hypothetical protein